MNGQQQQHHHHLTTTMGGSSKKSSHSGGMSSSRWILICFLLSATTFYCGIFVGYSMQDKQRQQQDEEHDTTTGSRIRSLGDKDKSWISSLQQQQSDGSNTNASNNNNLSDHVVGIPSSAMGKVVSGFGLVDRDAFNEKFDMGVPLDQTQTGNQNVLMLYSSPKAMPTSSEGSNTMSSTTGSPSMIAPQYYNSIDEATENCEQLNVVLHQVGRTKQCTAILGQYESYHIQKWMRLPDQIKEKVDPNVPLRFVSRGAQANGRISTKPPTKEQTLEHWISTASYIQSLQAALDKLSPIAAKVAANNGKNTIIVMVCNHGQSELLLNFVCNIHAKGLQDSLPNILVFATDNETKRLANHLGLTVFYDETIFGRMPVKAARAYADKTFSEIMLAKVYCVQMISMLGYDLLFQDVDVVWYKDPLPWFHDESNPSYHFDAYFQDDGNHGLYYAPFSANTGFYYIRNNERTQYFFNAFLMSGDLIISTKSHQIALIALLSEHASMYGLKVKIWERNLEEFPGGYTFHRKKDYMKKLVKGEVSPYIFHMSWTLNKANKLKFFEQMGEWYLNPVCQGSVHDEIEGGTSLATCCAAEPLVQCHFKDKPSRIPCKDSPPIDKNGRSFW